MNENHNVTLCSYRPSFERGTSIRDKNSNSMERLAVEVKRVKLCYGRGKNQKTILANINLTVPEGAIYGLLGPSGCGKTTLLRCVVGRLKPDSGYVRIFGFQPGEPGSQIPGPAIGYMPQEIAVYEDFTIEETLIYFGRIFRLSKEKLNERIDFLLAFLDLPHKNRLVQNLSGGQKRRVSLAAALVHSPPLLILDEPTVGVDPLLRQSIWQHLVTLTQTERITVIITTHYIEEARQAHYVGLMRQGRLLAENSPDELLAQYNMETLEEVFLKLCMTDSSQKANQIAAGDLTMNSTIDQKNMEEGGIVNPALEMENELNLNNNVIIKNNNKSQLANVLSVYSQGQNYSLPVDKSTMQSMQNQPSNLRTALNDNHNRRFEKRKGTIGEYWHTIMALFWKNLTRLRRNIPVLLFQFALPAIQVILFCICIGADPFNIPLAVVNQDNQLLSRQFLDNLDPYTVTQYKFDTVDDGKLAVRNGSMWGVLHIPENFTLALIKRMTLGEDVDDAIIEESTIKVYPDLTNQQISYTMERSFKDAFQVFAKKALETYGRNPQLAEFPLAMGEPVYGELKSQGYLEYMSSGVIVSITYIMATGLTALAFILERRDGLFERSLVAGVDTLQVLVAHALTQIIVMVVQIVFVLIFTFLVFEIPSRGPFIWVILLLLLQGCTGMAFGLVVSACCHEENTAVMMILGTFYPNLILSGIIWPLDAMPYWIRWFSYIQPQTLPTETLRHVLSRGWGIMEPGVYGGFIVTMIWMAFFLVSAAIIFRVNK